MKENCDHGDSEKSLSSHISSESDGSSSVSEVESLSISDASRYEWSKNIHSSISPLSP